MSDQQMHSNGSEIPTEGPSLNKPCMLDTPSVATPDNGSDFYNTPVASGTPVPSTTTDASTPATEATLPVQQAPLIPGLGLISNPNDQPAAPTQQVTTEQEPEAPAIKPDTEETTCPNENGAAVKQESAETAANQENGDEKNQAAIGEAMEVDQKAEETKLDADSGMIDHMKTEEDGEEEHPEWEVDSSPYESSSDSSSDSDDSSEDEDYPILSPEEQARILMQAEAGSDDEGEGKGKSGGYIRSANEVVEDVLPIPDVKITPDMPIVLLGNVKTIIENAVLIEASTSGEYQVLESGSLLCSEDRNILGVVAETLGRVENPLYTVMYATAAEPKERGLSKDMNVFYVPSHSTFVFTQPLKGLKGSDASNFHDEEVADEEIEFSDDEAEAEYKKKLKQKRQERKDAKDGGAGRGKRGAAGPSKLSHTELNYDDAGGEDGYTPLARPKNLHEMMGAREPPVEGTERASGFRGGRGRGRGSDRGRGGRGRGNGGRGGSFERDQDRRHQNQEGNSAQYAPSAPQQQPAAYGQPTYPQQQPPAFGMPQPFAPYPQYAPQQQAQMPQGAAPGQFPFQFPFQQPYAQPNPFQSIPPGAHINPLFLAALQQQQQQQQYQQPQQGQQTAPQGQQNPAMNFDQVKAQLDLLRNLSNNQGPPPS